VQVDRLEILGDKGAIKLDGPSLTCSGASPGERIYDLAAEYQGSYNQTIAHFVQSLRDGTPFEIDVSYLEGKKSLRINDAEQPCDPNSSSYEHVLRNALSWSRRFDRDRCVDRHVRSRHFLVYLSICSWSALSQHHNVFRIDCGCRFSDS